MRKKIRSVHDMARQSTTGMLIGILLLVLVVWTGCTGRTTDEKAVEKMAVEKVAQSGDIIFQASTSGQSKAIQLATKSRYSHMGIIYRKGEELFVYEAIQPVQLTPLKEWIGRGEEGHYVVKRIKNADEVLTGEALLRMEKFGAQYHNKPYDVYFEWSDDRIYCSELVWKIYKEATGIEIGVLQQLGDFDLSHAVVRQKLKERYGNTIPYDEKVISPAAMFRSDKLVTVIEN